MTPADKPRKQKRPTFKSFKASVNRRRLSVVYAFHTTVLIDEMEIALAAPTMGALKKAFIRYTQGMMNFDPDIVSKIAMIDKEQFILTRSGLRVRKTPDLPE